MPTESSAHRTRHPGTSIPRILALSLAFGALIPFLPLGYLTWAAYAADVGRVEREIEDSNRQIARLAANYLELLVLRVRQEAAGGPLLLPAASSTVRWARVGLDGIVTASQLAPGRVGRAGGYQQFLGTLAEDGEARFSRVERWIEGMAPTVIAARSGAAPAGGRSFLVGIIDPDALHSDMTARSGELLEPSMPTESSAHRTRPPGTSIPRILALSLGGIFPGILKSPRTPLC